MTTLTPETAAAYVASWNFDNSNGAVEVRSTVEHDYHGIPLIDVLAIDGNGYRQEWTVWSEPLMGGALHGEF